MNYPQGPHGGPAFGHHPPHSNAPYGGYPQSGWPGPPPPPKRNTGLIVGIAAAVVLVLLAALGITGFVAPGFFLTGDKEAGVTAPGTDPVDPAQLERATGDPRELANAIVAALQAKDSKATSGLMCSDASDTTKEMANVAPMVQHAQIQGDVTRESDTKATAKITVKASGRNAPLTVELTSADGKWCWHDTSLGRETAGEGAGETDPGAVAAREVVTKFLAKLKRGDSKGALELMCPDARSTHKRMLGHAGQARPALRIKETMSGGRLIPVQVEGTIGGRKSSGTVMTEGDENGGERCVNTFLFT